jgi:hypothetical protein
MGSKVLEFRETPIKREGYGASGRSWPAGDMRGMLTEIVL